MNAHPNPAYKAGPADAPPVNQSSLDFLFRGYNKIEFPIFDIQMIKEKGLPIAGNPFFIFD